MSECTESIVGRRCQCKEFDPWDHDHTSLVHVLWLLERDGLLTLDEGGDKVASRILGSHWAAAAFRGRGHG